MGLGFVGGCLGLGDVGLVEVHRYLQLVVDINPALVDGEDYV